MKSFADIVSRFGGPAKFGRAIGITTERASEMARRDSIPPAYWQNLLKAAGEAEHSEITAEALTELYASRRRSREEASAA